MANFPTSPSVGEQFTTSKVTYRWNGSAWDILEGVKQGIIASVTASNTKLLLHGEALTDSSYEPHTLTANGDVAASSVQKKFGSSSILFDGTGDYIQIPQSTDFAFDGDFTMEAWLWKAGNNPSDGYDIVMATNSNGGNNGGGWYWEWSDTRGFYMHDGNANAAVLAWNDTNYTSDSTWHHVAVVRSSGVVKLYLDGVEKASASYSTALLAGSNFRLGAVGNDQYKFNGYMDEVRVVKGSAEYTSNFTPPAAPYADPVVLPIGSIELTEGAEPSAVQGSSIIYATSSGMFVKNSVGTVTALTADASLNTADQIELSSVTDTPTGSAGTGKLVHWDRSGQDDPYTVLLIHADGAFTGDSSISPHTLEIQGPLLSDAQSKFGGKSFIFDGTNDYIQADSHDDFEFGSGDFTIEAWVYMSSAPSTTGEIFNRSATDSSDANGALHLNVNSNVGGKLNFNFYHGSASTFVCTDSDVFPTNTWVHVAAVRNGNTMTLYKNGVSVATDSYSGAIPAMAGKARISQRAYTTGYGYWNGHIDELRVSKGVARYTATFTPPAAPFTTAADSSGLYYVAPDGTATLIKGDS